MGYKDNALRHLDKVKFEHITPEQRLQLAQVYATLAVVEAIENAVDDGIGAAVINPKEIGDHVAQALRE